MISPKSLLSALQKRVLLLEDDLRARCNAQPEVDAPLRKDYEAAREKGRTGLTYNAWRDEELTQIAVAWILAGVFVRFLEDNELIDVPFLAGGNAARHQRAQDEHSLFFRQHPTASERDYFEHIFETIGKLPGMKDFFDRRHNPLWRVGPTADAAKALLEFWRKTDPDTGRIVHDFADAEWNTRFLGDLYQDLSEFARKRYALLQTPVFVEQFILDRTLTPAISTFGFKAVRMIDLTCGSGHFLLGGFQRLFRLWQTHEPGENPTVLARRALEQVFGVDLNPNVVAIARFRLLVAALRACGVTRIKDAPDFRLNLAAGDSLLHGSRFPKGESHEGVQQTFGGDELFRDELKHFYESEDREELHRILGQQYHVVVGNPPYITVTDSALNQAYRNRFDSCHRKYSLAAPFMERFFDLALTGDGKGQEPAGYVGMITANSFMKREFGKKLIEQFIPKWDLTHVIDTSGAHIPGHGTPTVILFGKHQPPVAQTVRTVMGIKGEQTTPTDPANGPVWTAIVKQIDLPDSQSEFVSASDVPRERFTKHPWSLGGGGASELRELLQEQCETTLEMFVEKDRNKPVIGFGAVMGEDEAFTARSRSTQISQLPQKFVKPLIEGEGIRDWSISWQSEAVFPYDDDIKIVADSKVLEWSWPLRTLLENRAVFGGETYRQAGKAYWGYHQIPIARNQATRLIAFASVATGNQFVLCEMRCLFPQASPIVKLKDSCNREDHLRYLGLMNSSVGGFWMKQVFHDKGGGGIGGGLATESWEHFYAFDGAKLAKFPVPEGPPHAIALNLERLARELNTHAPAGVLTIPASHTRAALDAAKQRWTETLQRMIALQEELDWECYQLYGLTEAKLVLPPDQVPPLQLGERAFEIVMARKLAAGELQTTWFERHGSKPITELPAHWPQPYRELVQRRIALMESDRNIALIEQPEYKRRWNVEPWDEQLERALREWLLNRLEGYFFGGERMASAPMAAAGEPPAPSADTLARLRSAWPAGQQPALVSTSQLATVVETDPNFLQLAEIYRGGPGFSVSQLVRELVEAEAVPFLPFQRYKEAGLRKRQDWEAVWDLQRQEDALEAEVKRLHPDLASAAVTALVKQRQADAIGDIPVPPKYASGDFKKSSWWKLRGKLDVPKERWVSYPGAERDGDAAPVIAWAGWDHQQQAQALAEYYLDASQNRGWDAAKLIPLLAGLADVLPWLQQWHNALDPDTSTRFGDYIAGFLDDEARKQGTTVAGLKMIRMGETK